MALGNVPVPVPHRDIRFGAQVVQPGKLVVDQRFQRANIDAAHAGGHILGKQGDDGKERRFPLPEAVEAVSSTFSSVLKMASAAAT